MKNDHAIPLVIATRNRDKIKEILRVLDDSGYLLYPLTEFQDVPEIEEDGRTIADNAKKKARVTAERTGLMALADDSGLEVDALHGAPGVLSSRFAGENVSYDDNTRKLLRSLKDVPNAARSARFRCVIAIAHEGEVRTVEGVCEGVILEAPRGENGFGYDPVFYIPDEGKTFAEMDIEYKNQISHRGLALRKARILLSELAGRRK